MISGDSLSFSYQQDTVLHRLSFNWTSGVVGVIGVNGAGKSTLLRILAGIYPAHSGQLLVSGKPIQSRQDRNWLRSQVGYLPQDPKWLPEITAFELVRYFAHLRLPKPAVDEAVSHALQVVDLIDRASTPLGKLSGGQAQRAFLAAATVHKPVILLLDEPTAGLDPIQRVALRKHLGAIAQNCLVVLATHLIEDVVHLSNELLVLDEGHARWQGSPTELLATQDETRSVNPSDDADFSSAAERSLMSLFSDYSAQARGIDGQS